jgi:hypothetical protein
MNQRIDAWTVLEPRNEHAMPKRAPRWPARTLAPDPLAAPVLTATAFCDECRR